MYLFRTSLCVSLAIMMIVGIDILAHGEDKLGPHKGFVRMPGAFHTEVVRQGSKLSVYLFDINWKNPITLQSWVEASINRNGVALKLVCKSKKNSFICDLPKGENLGSGELHIKAKRGEYPEALAVYSLPLMLTKSNDSPLSHP